MQEHEYKARDKTVQKMSRDGLREENLRSKTEKRITGREADERKVAGRREQELDFGKARKAHISDDKIDEITEGKHRVRSRRDFLEQEDISESEEMEISEIRDLKAGEEKSSPVSRSRLRKDSIRGHPGREAEPERYKDLKTRLYQDMLDNIVTREEYHEYNQRFSDKLHNAEEAKRELEKKKEKAVVEGKREHPWIEDFKSYQNITQLDRKAVVTLIDKIIVYGKDRLEIQFKYADEIQEMTEVAQNIREIEEKEGRFKCGA